MQEKEKTLKQMLVPPANNHLVDEYGETLVTRLRNLLVSFGIWDLSLGQLVKERYCILPKGVYSFQGENVANFMNFTNFGSRAAEVFRSMVKKEAPSYEDKIFLDYEPSKQ